MPQERRGGTMLAAEPLPLPLQRPPVPKPTALRGARFKVLHTTQCAARSAQRTLRFSCWAGPGRAGAGHARRVCHMPHQSRPALQVSVDGTHLGHNVPDRRGNRFCINLVSVAGKPAAES